MLCLPSHMMQAAYQKAPLRGGGPAAGVSSTLRASHSCCVSHSHNHTGITRTTRSSRSSSICGTHICTTNRLQPRPQRCLVLRASKSGKAGSSKGSQKQQQPPPQPPAGDDEWEDEDDSGVILLDDADEEYEEDEGDFLDIDDEGEEDADLAALGIDLSEADVGPGLITASVPWGETALAVAQQVLQLPQLQRVELYRFQVHAAAKRVEVRLDRMDDVYGSPSIDDIEVFSRQFLAGLEVQLGPEASGEISLEVSSPGAERQLVLPGDLTRFRSLPLRVEYHPSSEAAGVSGEQDGSSSTTTTAVLQMLELDEVAGSSVWALADVKANAPTKGRGLSKKQKQQRFTIPLADLVRVRIHVDF